MKLLIKAVFGKLVLGIFLVLTATATQAQSTANGAGHSETATIKYLGMQDDMVVFDVYYPNPDGNKFQVSVKDQDGISLYQNFFNDKGFYKQFRLSKMDRKKIVFIIHNNKDAFEVTKAFEVNVNSRFIQEVAVKKL